MRMKIKGGKGWHIDICGRYERGASNISIFEVTSISKKGKRYEKGVDIEDGGENKKIRKSKRSKRKKKKV